MAIAVNYHNYKAALRTEYEFIKTGDRSILLGAITWSVGKTKKKVFDTGLCRYCGKPSIDQLHQRVSVDRYA